MDMLLEENLRLRELSDRQGDQIAELRAALPAGEAGAATHAAKSKTKKPYRYPKGGKGR